MSRAQTDEVLNQNVERLRAYGVSIETLRDRTSDARHRGYTVLPRAIAKGTSAIAIPITDVLGCPVAAISTIAIASRQRGARVAGDPGDAVEAATSLSSMTAKYSGAPTVPGH